MKFINNWLYILSCLCVFGAPKTFFPLSTPQFFFTCGIFQGFEHNEWKRFVVVHITGRKLWDSKINKWGNLPKPLCALSDCYEMVSIISTLIFTIHYHHNLVLRFFECKIPADCTAYIIYLHDTPGWFLNTKDTFCHKSFIFFVSIYFKITLSYSLHYHRHTIYIYIKLFLTAILYLSLTNLQVVLSHVQDRVDCFTFIYIQCVQFSFVFHSLVKLFNLICYCIMLQL